MQLITKKKFKPLTVFSFHELSVLVIHTVNHHCQDTGIIFCECFSGKSEQCASFGYNI